MENKQAIEQLKDLRGSLIDAIDDNVPNSAFRKDVEALDLAIKALEGTALEVPVQEQSKEISKYELLVLLITIESLLSKSIQMLRSSKPFHESTT